VAKKVNIEEFDESEVMEMMGGRGVSPRTVAPAAPAAPVQNPAAAQNVPPTLSEKSERKQSAPEALSPTEHKLVAVEKNEPKAPPDEQVVTEEAPVTNQPTPVAEGEKFLPAKRKKQRPYDEMFLAIQNIGSLRKPIPVSPDIHQKLDIIVRIALDGRITLSNFVENILRHHIEEYKDELKNKYNENLKQDFL
jgi:hypothetical protein